MSEEADPDGSVSEQKLPASVLAEVLPSGWTKASRSARSPPLCLLEVLIGACLGPLMAAVPPLWRGRCELGRC